MGADAQEHGQGGQQRPPHGLHHRTNRRGVKGRSGDGGKGAGEPCDCEQLDETGRWTTQSETDERGGKRSSQEEGGARNGGSITVVGGGHEGADALDDAQHRRKAKRECLRLGNLASGPKRNMVHRRRLGLVEHVKQPGLGACG